MALALVKLWQLMHRACLNLSASVSGNLPEAPVVVGLFTVTVIVVLLPVLLLASMAFDIKECEAFESCVVSQLYA